MQTPKGGRQLALFQIFRSSVSRLCATSMMSCVGRKESNQMPKLRPCTPVSVCEQGCFTVQSGVCIQVYRAWQKRRSLAVNLAADLVGEHAGGNLY